VPLSKFYVFVNFWFFLVEKKLFDAARDGDVIELSALLKDHPEVNVNWRNGPLHAASYNGHTDYLPFFAFSSCSDFPFFKNGKKKKKKKVRRWS